MENIWRQQPYRKTALVTGASRGIGRATALKLLTENYRVIGTSVSGSNIDIGHPHFVVMKLDLASPREINAFPGKLSGLTSCIDLLINNAGTGSDVPLSVPEAATLDHTFKVNVYGLVMLTEALLSEIPAGGQILMLSSAMSLLPNIAPNGPAYRMSKAAVNVYVKMLSQRLAERDIKVNALEPGWVRTDMGGQDAPIAPEEAAAFIYHAISSGVVTGHFWSYGGQTGVPL